MMPTAAPLIAAILISLPFEALSGTTVGDLTVSRPIFPCQDGTTTPADASPISYTDYGDSLCEYDGESSVNGLIIYATDAQNLWYDSARYSRYAKYVIPSNLEFSSESKPFNSLMALVYYSQVDFELLGSMQYEVATSKDGPWIAVNVTHSPAIATSPDPPNPAFWHAVQETATLNTSYTYLRATWPPACEREINSTVRSCVTSIASGVEASRYFAPAVGEVSLFNEESYVGAPVHVNHEEDNDSLIVYWDPPRGVSEEEIISYVFYYQLAPNGGETKSVPFEKINIGNRRSVKIANLASDTTWVYRIAAVTASGEGLRSRQQWASTDSKQAIWTECPTLFPALRGTDDADWKPREDLRMPDIDYVIKPSDNSSEIFVHKVRSSDNKCGYLDLSTPEKHFWPCPETINDEEACCSAEGECGSGEAFCADPIMAPTGMRMNATRLKTRIPNYNASESNSAITIRPKLVTKNQSFDSSSNQLMSNSEAQTSLARHVSPSPSFSLVAAFVLGLLLIA